MLQLQPVRPVLARFLITEQCSVVFLKAGLRNEKVQDVLSVKEQELDTIGKCRLNMHGLTFLWKCVALLS
jgi:hypothetical protein